jgi:uncharacterized protein (TIGR02391 family)
MMQHFPDEATLMEMEPEELAPFILRYLTRPDAQGMSNRYNFTQSVPGQALSERFMEAWMWLEREGFLAPKPGDSGDWRFITRAGRAVVNEEDFAAFLKARLFPQHIDPVMTRTVKPLFMRGDYETAVFRAFKEVEVRVRERAGLGNKFYGRELMVRAFGETGPLSDSEAPKGERDALRELFCGAISSFKNPASHREVRFEDPHEVVDLISFANQLLRVVARSNVGNGRDVNWTPFVGPRGVEFKV